MNGSGRLSAVVAWTLVAGCDSVVTYGSSDAGGRGGDPAPTEVASGGTGGAATVSPPGPATSSGSGAGGSGSGGGWFMLACEEWSSSCSSDRFPEGESCEACFCRCCNHEYDTEPCMADPVCAGYVECVIGCSGDNACLVECELPCATGSEPACYLADCHNWVCPHACGDAFWPR